MDKMVEITPKRIDGRHNSSHLQISLRTKSSWHEDCCWCD
jgi:hypothetical protein